MGDRILPVVIIGISGATWTVIDPMLAQGALPNLRKLMSAGSWGVLESVRIAGDRHYRNQTAWPSLLTGKLPDNHGITQYFHTHKNLKSLGIWDFFNAKGLSAGIYSTPVFWPPPTINGFIIPAPHGRDNKAWPDELSFIMEYYRHHQDSKLKTRFIETLLKSLRFVPILFGRGHDRTIPFRLLAGVAKLSTTPDRELRALILRKAKLEFSTAIFLSLYRNYQPRFAIFTSFELDFISHRYWRYHEPERFHDSRSDAPPELGRAVTDAYLHMDTSIGMLLKRLPPQCIVAVVSEHGMAAEPASSEVGRWYYMINGGRIKSLLGIGPEIAAVPIARWIAFRRKDGGPLDRSLERQLAGITVWETGLPLFGTHFHADDEIVIKLNIHHSDYPGVEDIGMLQVTIPGQGTRPLAQVLEKAFPRRSAHHARDGVVILKGEGIRRGAELKGARITDIMPTLLFASGMEVPSGLDGQVLDVFS